MENENTIEKPEMPEPANQQTNALLEKQAELEGHYKSACAQEVLLIEQLKQIKKQREGLASQLELVRGLAG